MNAIEEKQNEERMLRYQFASRRYYNYAEKLNDLVWVCCFASWLAVFAPTTYGIVCLAVPFSLDIIAVILNLRLTANVSSAASLRKYFDAYVFGINMDQFTAREVQELEELSIAVVKRCPEKSKEQMANTGYDNPPGVRNWYELSQNLSKRDAIYECQRQNCWWNKRSTCRRLVGIGVGLSVLVPLSVVFLTQTEVAILQVVFSSGGLVSKCIERLVANVKYYTLSLKIDGALDVLTNSRSYKNIINLQAKIDARRAMPVLERNHIHKSHAKEYSELYHDATTIHEQ